MSYGFEDDPLEDSVVKHRKTYTPENYERESINAIKKAVGRTKEESKLQYLDFLKSLELKFSSILRMEESEGMPNPELRQSLQEVRMLITQLSGIS